MSVLKFHSMRPAIEHSDKVQIIHTAVERQSPVTSSRFGVNQAGFSLIEVLVVIAIMAIVAGLAAPSITTALEKQRNKDLAQSIVSALKESRNEALFRHQNIEVSVEDGIGLVVAVENPADPNKQKEKEERHIRTYPVGEDGLIEVNPTTITFRSNKSVSFGGGTGIEHRYVTYCNGKEKAGKLGRVVIVDRIGNISIDAENSKC